LAALTRSAELVAAVTTTMAAGVTPPSCMAMAGVTTIIMITTS
jgi:hypothetical protein